MPLGRAGQNVTVYVLDEHLQPVPLGAPGLICFSGVCVGRGYVNDPERTAAVYLHRPAPAGAAAVQGRRPRPLAARREAGVPRPPRLPGEDLRLPDRARRDREHAAAGARGPRRRSGRGRARRPGQAARRRSTPARRRWTWRCCAGSWRASLPHYMIPSAFHRREALPLTANGKTDTKALAALAAELDAAGDRRRRAAGARRPNGGSPPPTRPCSASRSARSAATTTSSTVAAPRCSAVKLAVAMERAVSLKDVTRHPVLADLAELLVDRDAQSRRHLSTGDCPREDSPIDDAMSSHPGSRSTSSCDPARPRCCGSNPPPTPSPGRPGTATRCARPSPGTARSSSAASDWTARAGRRRCSSGWPAA